MPNSILFSSWTLNPPLGCLPNRGLDMVCEGYLPTHCSFPSIAEEVAAPPHSKDHPHCAEPLTRLLNPPALIGLTPLISLSVDVGSFGYHESILQVYDCYIAHICIRYKRPWHQRWSSLVVKQWCYEWLSWLTSILPNGYNADRRSRYIIETILPKHLAAV